MTDSSSSAPRASRAMRGVTTASTHSPVRMAAGLVGAVFLVVGILGFIPGVTTNYDTIEFMGPDSEARLFGLFQVSYLHNIVHLAFGVVGLAMMRTAGAARAFLIGGGIVYLALWVYGLVVAEEASANFVPLNSADDWLHLGLGVGMIGLGALLGMGSSRAGPTR